MIFSDLSLKRAREIERDSKRIMKTSRGTKLDTRGVLSFRFVELFITRSWEIFFRRVCAIVGREKEQRIHKK